MQDKPGRFGSKTLKVWLLKSERFGWKKLVGLSTIIFWERSLPHFILSLNELLSIFTSEPCKQRVYTERNKSLPKSCLYDQTWWIDWIEVLWKQTMVIIINCSLLLSPNNHYCLLWCFMRQLFEKVDMRTTNDQFMLIQGFFTDSEIGIFYCLSWWYLPGKHVKKFYLIVYMH